MNDALKLKAPIEIEMAVSITDGNGTNGIIVVSLGKGSYPTLSEITEALQAAKEAAEEQGFRLMDKKEWWNSVCPPLHEEGETTPFAIPGGTEWDE